jgi:hypothetical protein
VVYSVITSDLGEPNAFEEAFIGPNKAEWRKAIQEEPTNFTKKGVSKMINKDQLMKTLKRKPISTKWVFKKKV